MWSLEAVAIVVETMMSSSAFEDYSTSAGPQPAGTSLSSGGSSDDGALPILLSTAFAIGLCDLKARLCVFSFFERVSPHFPVGRPSLVLIVLL